MTDDICGPARSGNGTAGRQPRWRGDGGNLRIVSRFEFTLYPVLVILGVLCNQHVRPAR
jgi:hypothetical protein